MKLGAWCRAFVAADEAARGQMLLDVGPRLAEWFDDVDEDMRHAANAIVDAPVGAIEELCVTMVIAVPPDVRMYLPLVMSTGLLEAKDNPAVRAIVRGITRGLALASAADDEDEDDGPALPN